MKKVIVGLTGASGSVYFLRLIEILMKHEIELHIIATDHGKQVLEYETGKNLEEQVNLFDNNKGKLIMEDNSNLFSCVASGSYRCDVMVIVPCSMSTIAELANGVTKTLLTRAADVMMKERRGLIVVPRETPLSTLHLKNMYELSKLGVTILPAMPGFYNHPGTLEDVVDFVVGKTLDCMEIENNCYERWKGNNQNEN